MVNYKESAKRARETATFRFTSYEKQLLSHLADIQGMTQTALIRSLLAERADQLGIFELPAPPKKRKPGRPKSIVPVVVQPTVVAIEPERRDIAERIYSPTDMAPDTFGMLIARFQISFKSRTEKMRNELEQTVRFITGVTGDTVLLPPEWLLEDIDALLLADVRDRIQETGMRFPQKNLHLTYLRMMFNFGVKEGMISEDARPMETLRSFTAKEVADAFPLPIKTL